MLGAFGALGVTLGLLFLALHVLRRLHGGAAAGRGVPLQVLQRIPTGPRQGVALLRVGDRVLVVSMAERGASLLTELSGETLAEALGGATPAAQALAFQGRHPEPFAALRAGSANGAEARLVRFLVESWPLRSLRSLRVTRGWVPRVLPAILLIAGAGVLLIADPASLHAQTPAPSVAAPTSPALTTPSAAQADPAKAVGSSSTAPGAQLPASSRIIPISPTSPAPARQALPALPTPAGPQAPTVDGPASPKIDFKIGEGAEQVHLSGTIGLVVFMGALTLLPAMFLLMTSFTRILIVLHFLRSAIGTQTTPPGQLLVALAVLLTGVVMHPIIERANTEAIKPYFDGQLSQTQAYEKGLAPFREFMLSNTRDQDVAAFAEMSGAADVDSLEALPTVTIVAAFVTSELRTAFQMGFVIFLPFVVVDLIVASVLMSMGMFMLPPAMVSLPFKLLLFVLADGWTLVVRNLLSSFHGASA
jgi:flagellar biosynthesis protein FliP